MVGNETPINNPDSEAVRTHLNIVQDVISRMAHNSSSCKTWCVTLVAAIMVLVARTDNPGYSLIALIPALLFLFLDSYYLGMERAFRKSYDCFVNKLVNGRLVLSDLYAVGPTKLDSREKLSVLLSYAIGPFYLAVLAAIFLIYFLAAHCV